MHALGLLALLTAPLLAKAAVPLYGQCGGIGYTGETVCVSGATCVFSNDWYSQCLPGGATSSTRTSSSSIRTSSTTGTNPTGNPNPPSGLVGYASLNGGTTGGAGGTTTTVSSLTALRAAVTGTARKIVYISGIITGDNDEIDVGSNTSVFGIGSNSGVTNGGFRVKAGNSNIIFRNLKLSLSPAPVDLIGIEGGVNIWVDHCDFSATLNSGKDDYDGLLDIKNGADFITVSYNIFHDSWKTSLIGHSDNAGSTDIGHFRVTYHHNIFSNVNSRTPSLRFGTGHMFSNYYTNVLESGINSRLGAQVLVESCVFRNAKKPLMTAEYEGYAVERNNDWGGSTPDLSRPGNLNSVPYSYTVTPVGSVISTVQANAGVGKVSV